MTTIPSGMPVLSSGAHSRPEDGACVMELVSFLAGEAWTDHPACTHPVLGSVARNVNDRMADRNRHLLIPLIGRLFGTAPPVDRDEAKRLSVGLAVYSAKSVLHLVRPAQLDQAKRYIAAAERYLASGERGAYGDAAAAAAAAEAAAAAAAAAEAAAAAADAAAYGYPGAAADAAADAAAYGYAAAAAAAAAAAYGYAYGAAAAYGYAAAAAAAAAWHIRDQKMVDRLARLIDEYDRLVGRTNHRDVTPADLHHLAARVTA